ncbi:MAG: hypothetical protein V2I67_00095 [Thermoanaerobaculales bacterium]|jgi:hypothetical protein|nr:hypothetical protein [Thermoanaerobaculales bacterium]
MKRILSGSLTHLAPQALMRLLSATATSGVLELVTDEGSFRMEIDHGWTAVPPPDQLENAGRVLACAEGAFRFEPGDVPSIEGPSLSLGAFADAVRLGLRDLENARMTDVEVDRLVAGEITEIAQAATLPNIHLLPAEPPVNPLDDLLEGLADQAPQELLFAQVGVVAPDPRLWRGALENDWRRRGWEVRRIGTADEFEPSNLDVVVVHQASGVSRRANEEWWLDLLKVARESEPPLPVVWAAPLGDPSWVHQLVAEGVSFLLPVAPGEGGEIQSRFVDNLTTVVDRQLRAHRPVNRPVLPAAVTELVDVLLHETDSEQAVGVLLQLASSHLVRGAVMAVEETAIRCRAGFGYPLARGTQALPRGLGILERVIRSGQPTIGIDPKAEGPHRLAEVLGLEELPAATAVVPLGIAASVTGLLVADREGEVLPDLSELVVLAGRLGGVALQS